MPEEYCELIQSIHIALVWRIMDTTGAHGLRYYKSHTMRFITNSIYPPYICRSINHIIHVPLIDLEIRYGARLLEGDPFCNVSLKLRIMMHSSKTVCAGNK